MIAEAQLIPRHITDVIAKIWRLQVHGSCHAALINPAGDSHRPLYSLGTELISARCDRLFRA